MPFPKNIYFYNMDLYTENCVLFFEENWTKKKAVGNICGNGLFLTADGEWKIRIRTMYEKNKKLNLLKNKISRRIFHIYLYWSYADKKCLVDSWTVFTSEYF